MGSQQKTNKSTYADDVSASALEAAETAVNTLLVAVKNACLYPEDHAVCQHSISHAFSHIDSFIKDYGNLKITVNQNQFIYEEKVIYHAPHDSSNLALTFFRDGILWLDFQQGIKDEELKGLLQIINHYKNPQEEAEGDLVTALWEADFDHISYAAADINPDPDIFLDFPLFQVSGNAGHGGYQVAISSRTGMAAADTLDDKQNSGQQFQPQGKEIINTAARISSSATCIPQEAAGKRIYGQGNGPQVSQSLSSPGTDQEQRTGKQRRSKNLGIAVPLLQGEHHLWTLTTEEEKTLQLMVVEEEKRSRSENVFDVLLHILKIQTSEVDFTGILSFLQDEFREALFLRQFSAALHLLQILRAMYDQKTPGDKWIRPLIAKFFITISSPPVLGVLSKIWPEIIEQEPEGQQLLLVQICRQLTPIANQTLIPLLAVKTTNQLQQMLEKIVRNFAARDLDTLNPLLENQDESVVLKLMEIIAVVDDPKTARILLKLAKHPDSQIRKEAIKILLNREPTLLPKLLHCLDDTSETIRLMMLHHLGRKRHKLAEHLLLEYFSRHTFHADESSHLLNCYRALGKCGSDRCIPFLKKMLLEHSWHIFGNLAMNHRVGAALALELLKTEPAAKILKQAARSLNPQIRLACRKAKERKR